MSEALNTRPPAVGDRGTLRLLAFIPDASGTFIEALYLGMDGAPLDAGSSGHLLDDIDLGDYDCDDLPELPREAGLWLLTWSWTVVLHPDAAADDDEDDEQDAAADVELTTAKYAAIGAWTRPTLEQLRELGALPPATGEGADA